MHLSAVSRALQAIERYRMPPTLIDQAILAAINVSLCLASAGDDRTAEGFNDDILRNGRGFGGNEGMHSSN